MGAQVILLFFFSLLVSLIIQPPSNFGNFTIFGLSTLSLSLSLFSFLAFTLYLYWWWTENWTNSNSSMRVVQVKKARMALLGMAVVHRHMGRPWGKHMDDPKHLGIFQESLSTRVSELSHVLPVWGISKIHVHCYNFLLST